MACCQRRRRSRWQADELQKRCWGLCARGRNAWPQHVQRRLSIGAISAQQTARSQSRQSRPTITTSTPTHPQSASTAPPSALPHWATSPRRPLRRPSAAKWIHSHERGRVNSYERQGRNLTTSNPQYRCAPRSKLKSVVLVLAIPSFFEIKESDGARSFPKRISDVIFFEARADCKLERGKRTRESPIQMT